MQNANARWLFFFASYSDRSVHFLWGSVRLSHCLSKLSAYWFYAHKLCFFWSFLIVLSADHYEALGRQEEPEHWFRRKTHRSKGGQHLKTFRKSSLKGDLELDLAPPAAPLWMQSIHPTFISFKKTNHTLQRWQHADKKHLETRTFLQRIQQK